MKDTTARPLEQVPQDAETRLQQGLALILSALPELLFRWLASRKQ